MPASNAAQTFSTAAARLPRTAHSNWSCTSEPALREPGRGGVLMHQAGAMAIPEAGGKAHRHENSAQPRSNRPRLAWRDRAQSRRRPQRKLPLARLTGAARR